MFRSRKKETVKDEAQIYLESVKDEPDMPDPCEKEDEALEEIAAKDSAAHYDILNLLTLAVIVLFFGAVFLALTNRQDFSGDNALTKESFFSGNYLARVEKDFNESIPLRDHLHNARSYIKYCFGIGNKTDIIDIKSSREKDDPYSIENEAADDSPLTDSKAAGNEEDDSRAETIPQETEEDEDITRRKIDTIRMNPQASSSSSEEDEEQTSTTVNYRAPGATTTTTVPPQTETRPPDTEPPVTDESRPDSETEPSDTSAPEEPPDE